MKTVSLVLLLCIFRFSSNRCIHDELTYTTEYAKVDYGDEGRNLASTYSNIRIGVDYTYFPENNTIYSYVKDKLMPAAIAYFQRTLKVIPITSAFKYDQDVICDVLDTPTAYNTTGLTNDITFIITGEESTEDFIAYALPCVLHPDTNRYESIFYIQSRPLIARVSYNYNFVKGTDFDGDFQTTLHEMIHAFGFTAGVFDMFYDTTTQSVKQNVTKTATINNEEVTFFVLEPAVTVAREYFGCTTLDGLLLENQGDSGSKGSHLERRIFGNEVMTASSIDDARLTKLSLSFLESTGWYQVDYTMAEPMYWGKGEGCSFIYENCVNNGATATSFPKEFCLEITKPGCDSTGKVKAYCGTTAVTTNTSLNPNFDYFGDNTILDDAFADNCPFFKGFLDSKCESPSGAASAILVRAEYYGLGSRCFTGNLFDEGIDITTTNYCFSFQCTGTSPNYQLTVNIGNQSVLCDSKTSKAVTGFSGNIDCPDPNLFCQTSGDKYCPKGCCGNGNCVSNACVCNVGWNGTDCAFPTGVKYIILVILRLLIMLKH